VESSSAVGAAVGMSVVAVVLVLVCLAVVILLLRRRRTRRRSGCMNDAVCSAGASTHNIKLRANARKEVSALQ